MESDSLNPLSNVHPRGLRLVLLGLFLLCVTLAAYFPSLSVRTTPENRWLWDDWSLHSTPALHRSDGLADFWHYPPRNELEEHYWPVTYTVFWLQARIWGMDAFAFRLTNIVLHVVNTLLLWLLLRRMQIPAAWLGALFFGIHPIHVESVAWIIELKDVLSGLFYLLAAHAYLSSTTASSHTSTQQRLGMISCIAFFVLAIWSKSVAITFPVAAALYEWWRGGMPQVRRRHRLLLGLLAIAGLLATLDLIVAMRSGRQPTDFPLVQRVALAGHAFWFYLWKLLVPYPQSLIYAKWDLAGLGITGWIPTLLAILVMVGVFAWQHRIGRGIPFAWAFYVITLLPTLGLIPFSYMQHAYVADRFQYLASIGPLVLLASGAARLFQAAGNRYGRGLLAGLLGGLVVLWTWLTMQRAEMFGSAKTILRDTVRRNPDAWVAHQMLGTIEAREGQWEEARNHFEQALRIQPEDASLRANLAFVLYQLGAYAQALENAQRALQLNPKSAWGLAVRGAVQAKLGNTSAARSDLRQALRVAPSHPFAQRILEDIDSSPTQTQRTPASELLTTLPHHSPEDTTSSPTKALPPQSF
ncbi:MAG: tetratricopeptide repeat protein [Candidatus Hydrogenedentota bacterium]|nr:MAG: tetratricopeptide repeat protein [Candidatus Hydrogenedentota bacterium]GIX45150.1 MAG: O-GlcNAc transferase [Candidatus Sumerlaea sp.]